MKPLPSGLPTSVDGKADRGVKNRKSAFLISSWLLVTPVFFLFFGSSPFSPDDEHWKSRQSRSHCIKEGSERPPNLRTSGSLILT